jgi:hypothetical protein
MSTAGWMDHHVPDYEFERSRCALFASQVRDFIEQPNKPEFSHQWLSEFNVNYDCSEFNKLFYEHHSEIHFEPNNSNLNFIKQYTHPFYGFTHYTLTQKREFPLTANGLPPWENVFRPYSKRVI